MKRVLVTGATGGLGRNAVDALLEKGVEVRASGRNTEVGKRLSAQGAQFVPLDLGACSSSDATRLVAGVDTVWHCAALSSPWGKRSEYAAANVIATRKLAEAAAKSGVARFIHVSTAAVYFDYRHRYDIPESFRPTTYVNAYAFSKAEAERCVQDVSMRFSDMRSVILRPRAIFGRYDQVLIPRLYRLLTERRGRLPLPRGGAVTIDITYVENVVHAMWLATVGANIPSGAVINITNHEPVVLRDALRQLFETELRRPFNVISLPYPLLAAAAAGLQAISCITRKEPSLSPYSVGALSYDMTLDNQTSRQLLGYVPPVRLADGIRHTADWLKLHG
jgi:nucleoside-diphosphate-sugar epimerase